MPAAGLSPGRAECWTPRACNTITFRYGAASPPSSGSCASGRDRVAVDPAAFGAAAAGRDHGADRGAVGCGFLGDMAMSAALAFDDLTLGYDRHPAVHHLAAPWSRRAGGGRWAERRRQIDPVQGHRRDAQAACRQHRARGIRARDIAYLPQAAEIDRSFPISVYDMVAMGLWRTTPACSAASAGEDRAGDRRGASRPSASPDSRQRPIGTLSGGQMQRDAVRPPAAAGCAA